MIYHYSSYSLTLLIATVISVSLAVFAWKKRDVPGGKYFCFLMLVISTWTFTGALEMAGSEPAVKIFWSKMGYIGSSCSAILLFLFILTYIQKDSWLSPVKLTALSIIPAITLILVATNEHHGLIWPKITPLTDQPGAILVYDHGVGVWIIMSYSYILLMICAILILQSVLNAPRLYKKQAHIFITAMIFPWLGSCLYLFKLTPFTGFDLTPIGFTVSGMLLAIAIKKYQFLDIVPIAHGVLFQNMNNGVIVIDESKRIVDINPAAIKMFNTDNSILGEPLDRIIDGSQYPMLFGENDNMLAEISIANGTVFLEVTISSIRNRDRKRSGTLLIFQNITERKNAETALRESDARWEFALEGNMYGVVDWDLSAGKAFYSPRFKELLGYNDTDLTNDFDMMKELVHEDDRNGFLSSIQEHFVDKTPFYQNEHRILHKNGTYIWVLDRGKVMHRNPDGSPQRVIATFADITERKMQEKERENLINELKKALSEIKTLRGFIPICSHCKKIRTDKGYWEQLEKYIGDRSEAEFTHGVCPECMDKYYKSFLSRKADNPGGNATDVRN